MNHTQTKEKLVNKRNNNYNLFPLNNDSNDSNNNLEIINQLNRNK